MTTDITSALAGLRFPRDLQLPNRVVRSPRLLSFIPSEELAPIVAAYTAAQRAASDAAKVPFEADDLTAGVRTSIQKGEEVDAAALVKKMAQQAALREAHRNAVAFFQTLPDGPRDDLAGLIMDYVPELHAGLGEQLDAVLDQAEEAITALDGAYDAESAIDQGVTAEFSTFRGLVAEYASIRSDYRQVLDATGDHPFGTGDGRLAFALFGGIADVYPDILPAGPDAPRLEGWQHTRPEPFPIYETGDRAHLLYVVRHRAALKPHIITAAEATTALKAAKAAKAAREAEASDRPVPGGELSQCYGGERGVIRRKLEA